MCAPVPNNTRAKSRGASDVQSITEAAAPRFLFSSGRGHTRCETVTGVQTCALPISMSGRVVLGEWNARISNHLRRIKHTEPEARGRSEERRVGKECSHTCRSWG